MRLDPIGPLQATENNIVAALSTGSKPYCGAPPPAPATRRLHLSARIAALGSATRDWAIGGRRVLARERGARTGERGPARW